MIKIIFVESEGGFFYFSSIREIEEAMNRMKNMTEGEEDTFFV